MKLRHLIFIPLFTLVNSLSAEHLPGGNITYECLGGTQYRVTLTLFRDCEGSPLSPQTLNFIGNCGISFEVANLDMGTGLEVSQLCPTDLPNSSCSGGNLPGIEVYRGEVTLNLPNCNSWRITWNECCRSASQNLVGSPGTFVEARLNSVTAPCNNSPQFTQDVIPYVCVNEPVSYNLAVTEADGHSLRYRLMNARHSATGTAVNYQSGNSGAQPIAGMAIDSLTGQVTFTPTMIGNIVTVVRVDEYLPGGELAGMVMRDFLFVVIPCPNTPPDPTSGELNVVSGDTIAASGTGLAICTIGNFCFNAVITDQEAAQSLSLVSNVTTVIPGSTFNTSGTNPATATICWEGESLAAGTYGFVITAEDNACPTPGITTYAYTVTVLADSVAACLGTFIQIESDHAGNWSLWPSPANEILNVRLEAPGGSHMRLFEAGGRLVKEQRLETGLNAVAVGDLPDGVYIMRMLLGEKEVGSRVIIQR